MDEVGQPGGAQPGTSGDHWAGEALVGGADAAQHDRTPWPPNVLPDDFESASADIIAPISPAWRSSAQNRIIDDASDHAQLLASLRVARANIGRAITGRAVVNALTEDTIESYQVAVNEPESGAGIPGEAAAERAISSPSAPVVGLPVAGLPVAASPVAGLPVVEEAIDHSAAVRSSSDPLNDAADPVVVPSALHVSPAAEPAGVPAGVPFDPVMRHSVPPPRSPSNRIPTESSTEPPRRAATDSYRASPAPSEPAEPPAVAAGGAGGAADGGQTPSPPGSCPAVAAPHSRSAGCARGTGRRRLRLLRRRHRDHPAAPGGWAGAEPDRKSSAPRRAAGRATSRSRRHCRAGGRPARARRCERAASRKSRWHAHAATRSCRRCGSRPG